jgi:ABC-2 type transport system ATP-binding protein
MEWLARFGLANAAHRQVRTFSKGMVQRTALAHALSIRPRLLVLDEPLSGLDPVGRKDVVDILADYKRAGGTLFFSSHVLHDVERLADRFGLINRGRLLALQSPDDIVAGEQMVTVRSLGVAEPTGFAREGGDRWVAEVAHADLWRVLDELRGYGHEVLEVRPAMSLESAFFRFLQADGAEARTGS